MANYVHAVEINNLVTGVVGNRADMEYCASIALEGFVSNCGRMCGIIQNKAVEVSFLSGFHIMMHYFHKLALIKPLFSLGIAIILCSVAINSLKIPPKFQKL